jgi:hypothetical protein
VRALSYKTKVASARPALYAILPAADDRTRFIKKLIVLKSIILPDYYDRKYEKHAQNFTEYTKWKPST